MELANIEWLPILQFLFGPPMILWAIHRWYSHPHHAGIDIALGTINSIGFLFWLVK